MRILIAILIMALFYGFAAFYIIRTFVIAFTFRSKAPFVPSRRGKIDFAIKALNIQPGDKFIDIGCGDGRVVLRAARSHPEADFTGIELNRVLVWWARMMAQIYNVSNAKFERADIYKYDVSGYNKVYLYLATFFIADIMPLLEKQLRSGSEVLSLSFGFGKEFESTHEIKKSETINDNISIWRKE